MPLIRKSGGTPSPADETSAAGSKLSNGTSEERWAAARALSGRPDAVKTLGEALSTEQEPRVREAILTGLARIGTPQSAEVILPLIRSDDADLRTGGIDALRAMPKALEAHLPGLLRDADADVRVLACDLVRELPGEAATPLLSDLLEHEPQANVCAAAIDVLTECGGPEALPALTRCAERFADVPFITFAARIAQDRIRAQAPARGD